jgi:sedoheptulokinase
MAVSLGIDIGTTKVAIVIYDTENKTILDHAYQNTKTDIPTEEWRSEQSVEKILSAIDNLMTSLDNEKKKKVSAIGVTGQMHGVVLWNKNETGNLITWKDQRASTLNILKDINKISGAENLKDGFGTTTLACLARNQELKKWQYASTIHDYLVFKICGLETPVTDPGNAASWGAFDIVNRQWQTNTIAELGIPERFFPSVATGKTGILTDKFAQKWGLPEALPVAVAIGDNQASILATSEKPDDEIYLTIGTGAQLSVVIDKQTAEKLSDFQTMEIRAYLDNKYLAVAAPLCGGQAFAWLADVVQNWQKELGFSELPEEKLFRKLDALGMDNLDAKLEIKPNFLGERHNQELSAEITNINLSNFKLGEVSAALARGIVNNMKRMMPEKLFARKKVVVGSGNAVRHLKVMQKMIELEFNLPLKIKDTKEEAAIGAAILAERS